MANKKDENMTTISLRISQEEKAKLQEIADEMDLSISYLVRQAIRQYLSK